MFAQERRPALAILCLALVSGILAVAYEVLWTRHLLNLFGSTTTATASMLAAFMAGMALGAWAMGRASEAARRPLLIYAGLEVVLGAYGLGIGGIIESVAAFLPAGAVYGPGGLPLTLPIRTFGHLIILILPTILMGATLPALAAALQLHGGSAPRDLAALYGLNVLGGVAGAFTTGFLTLPSYGLSQSQNLLSIMAVLAAAAATAIDRTARSQRLVMTPTDSWTLPDNSQVAPATLYGALFLSGFAALGYEILWTRILVLVIGSSTYAFSLMLGTYLLGLTLGSLWIARHIDRLKSPAVVLQHLQLAIAFVAIAGTMLFRLLPQFALAGVASLGTSPAAVVAINATLAAALVLAPTFFIGAAFPIAARLMQRGPTRRGREIGAALAWVSGGHVVGVLTTVFAIVPMAGLQGGVATLAVFNVAAALLLWLGMRHSLSPVNLTMPIAIIAIAGLAWAVPAWDTYLMTSGIYRQAPAYLNLVGTWRNLERVFAQYQTRYYREGNEAVVAVFERPTLTERPHVVLTIDGKVDASTGADMSTQILSGYLPALFGPEKRNALVIGLASGVTVGALAQSPFERIDVVEIEAAVVGASRVFDTESHAPLKDPRVRVVIEDGRQFLRSAGPSYDVIVSEPSNPWISSSARLFTREFFTLVREGLSSDGIFVQWVPLYGLDESLFRALLRTLFDVFHDAVVFRVAESDLVVVASAGPLMLKPEALATLFDRATAASDLARADVHTPRDLMALLIADDKSLRSVLGLGPLNTDDNGLLEFGSPWYLLRDTKQSNLLLLMEAAKDPVFGDRLASAWSDEKAGHRFLASVAREHLRAGRIELAHTIAAALARRDDKDRPTMLLGDIEYARGNVDGARRMWLEQESAESWPRLASAAFSQGELEVAARYFNRAPMDTLSERHRVEFGLALIGLGRENDAWKALDIPSREGVRPPSVIAPLLRDYLDSRSSSGARASSEERIFADNLTALRRCLEREGCTDEFDQLVVWIEDLGATMPNQVRERLSRELEATITRPLTVYYKAVRHLWLGEFDEANGALARYLELIPGGDADSKAHELAALALHSMK